LRLRYEQFRSETADVLGLAFAQTHDLNGRLTTAGHPPGRAGGPSDVWAPPVARP
jgi:hypothetical protein